jgi:hypothetical protein
VLITLHRRFAFALRQAFDARGALDRGACETRNRSSKTQPKRARNRAQTEQPLRRSLAFSLPVAPIDIEAEHMQAKRGCDSYQRSERVDKRGREIEGLSEDHAASLDCSVQSSSTVTTPPVAFEMRLAVSNFRILLPWKAWKTVVYATPAALLSRESSPCGFDFTQSWRVTPQA